MFFALCICLLFAVMFLSIALATLAMLPAIRIANRFADQADSSRMANVLFGLRAFPILLGGLASLGLALPAFLKFEPHTTHEIPGAPLLLLAGFGGVLTVVVAIRYALVLHATRRLRKQWLKNATLLPGAKTRIPVYCVEQATSLLAVTGIFSPRIFVSRDVVDSLSSAELDAALSHELAHVNAVDNLKQLFLKVTSAPNWLRPLAKVDSLWARFAELAADERAMTSGASVLELSSALVKVGRLSGVRQHPARLAASHLVDSCSAVTTARVARLRDLLEHERPQAFTASRHHVTTLVCLGSVFALYLLLLGTVLPQIHEALELLVR